MGNILSHINRALFIDWTCCIRFRFICRHLLAGLLALGLPVLALSNDAHWSLQFPKPPQAAAMSAATGMADAVGSPGVRAARWHNGKLWMAGVWEAGVDPGDFKRRQTNSYWHLWTWSEQEGYQVEAHFHTTQGGRGPDGVINDFLFLPDGRLVVAGEFTRIDNTGGNRYHNVNAVAVFDPHEPGPDKWRPLGRVQYNGTVSPGGSIKAIAYDPEGKHLYMGGSFAGIPLTNPVRSNAFHRYSFETGTYEAIPAGPAGGRPEVFRIRVDTSTTPSTVYVGGKFHYVGGNGLNPENSASTAGYSTGFAAWQDGTGWRRFPADFPTDGSAGKENGILQRAGDFMYFDAALVRDFLVDGEDIWICGAFSEGEGRPPLRGIAKWDRQQQAWIDPTGKGGVGRDCFNVARADNGNIYFSGAFGGRKGVNQFFDGFKNGEAGHSVIVHDPDTGDWKQLGSGLSTKVMPEIRLTIDGNNVYFVGDFTHIAPGNFGSTADKAMESHFIARWNETINFTDSPVQVAAINGPYQQYAVTTGAPTGSQHWSRAFVKPERGVQQAVTGLDVSIGTPDISGIVWIGDTLYFGGSWEAERGTRWYAWSFRPGEGYQRLAWDRGEGIQSPPEGIKTHKGKLYAYGAISSHSGIGVYDPESRSWSNIQGTYNGETVVGNTALQGAGVINDIAWNDKTGDMFLVGNWASPLTLPDSPFPKDTAAALRIDAEGEYHILGHDLKPEDPQKPIKGIYAIVLDHSQDPVGIYVAGTFNYYGPVPTTNARMLFNVARWDYTANDWAPVGKGNFVHLSDVDRKWYPEGLPGLPTRPTESGYTNYNGFLNAGFPRVLSLALDNSGNLYAGGTLGIVSRNESVAARHKVETFGIARYDRKTDTWSPATSVGGVSRDVRQMTFLDDRRLLLSGSFIYDEHFNQLHNIAILDIETGQLTPLGGGLHRASREHVIGSQVVHTVQGQQLWFAGLFDHAGINANDLTAAPVQSNMLALYDPTINLDPNRNLVIAPVAPVKAPQGAAVAVNVQLQGELKGGEGKITWYEKRANGSFGTKGEGPSLNASIRVAPGDGDQYLYVAVTGPNGVEGGKIPVRIPVE